MKLKIVAFISLMILISAHTFGQLGVSYHQSTIPFVGLNTQMGERFLPELRVGTNYFFEDISFELDVNYLIVKKDSYDFYSGVGARILVNEGLVIPVGINFYPLDNKNFGFHIEVAGMLGESSILRGSWGIRFILE